LGVITTLNTLKPTSTQYFSCVKTLKIGTYQLPPT